MLVDGVHGDERDLVVHIGGRGGAGSALALEHGHAGVGDLAAQALALQGGHSGLYALVAHHVGVLGHGGQQVAVVNEAHDGVRLIEAHAHDGLAGGLNGVARASGGALVAAIDAHNALGDEVLGDGLGLGGVALAELGLQQGVAGALKGGTEALVPGNGGGGGVVHADDADGAGLHPRGLETVDHGLAGGGARGLVVGGEGGLGVHIGGGVHVDDLHALGLGVLQGGGDGVGAVGRHDDGVIAAGHRVVHTLNLLGVVLGVGGHEVHGDTQLLGGLLGALVQGNPVLVDGVHGNQGDLVALIAALFAVVAAGASGQQAHEHTQAAQQGKDLVLLHLIFLLVIVLVWFVPIETPQGALYKGITS